jgi:hypothetical protein
VVETKSEASKPLAREVASGVAGCDWGGGCSYWLSQAKEASAGRKVLLLNLEESESVRINTQLVPSRVIRERADGKQCFRICGVEWCGELSEAASGVQGDQKGDKPRGGGRVLIVAGARPVHCTSGHRHTPLLQLEVSAARKGAARHAQARLSPSLHRAASHAATAKVLLLRLRSLLPCARLPSARRSDERSAVVVVLLTRAYALPAHDATGGHVGAVAWSRA